MSEYVQGGRALGDVPHTTSAEGIAAVTRAAGARVGRPAGWWGWLGFIASEATLFGCMIGTYYYLRFHTAVWPPHGIPKPDVVLPIVLALVLASTSIPMQLASTAAHAGRLASARLLVLVAFVVQAGYFAYEVHDFDAQLHERFQITRNAYSSIYYTLLGADHAHVFFGLLFDLWLLAKLARGLTTYRLNALQGIAWYWHAVNLITLAVIGTLASAAA